MNKEPKELITLAILEEYRALREEMKTIVDRQYTQMYWVISSVAILVAAIINAWQQILSHPLISSGLFIVLIPGVITAYILSWSHIITKIAKIGSHIYKIESNLSSLLVDDLPEGSVSPSLLTNIRYPISWEHFLWKAKSHKLVLRTYVGVKLSAAFIYLMFIFMGASLLKIHYWDNHANLQYWHFWLIIFASVILWLTIWLSIFHFIKRDLLSSLKEVESNKVESLCR